MTPAIAVAKGAHSSSKLTIVVAMQNGIWFEISIGAIRNGPNYISSLGASKGS